MSIMSSKGKVELTDEQVAEIVYMLDDELHEVYAEVFYSVVGDDYDYFTIEDMDRIKQGLANFITHGTIKV